MSYKLSFKSPSPGLIGLMVAATTIPLGIVIYGVSSFGQLGKTSVTESKLIAPPQIVTALGRLEPETEIIKLSAPLALDGDRIVEVLVKEGDNVKLGQVIAILQTRDLLKNAVIQSTKQVEVAQAKLAQIKAGAKLGEIQEQSAIVERIKAQYTGDRQAQEENIARISAQWEGDRIAQTATINKVTAELKNAESEYKRYEKLFSEGAISSSVIDSKRLNVETAKQTLSESQAILNRINTTANKQLAEAKVALNRINTTSNKQISETQAKLNSIAEVRPVDVQLAQTEIESAIANLNRAKTELEAAYIRAPMAGQIIKIHTRVGEKIDKEGIADFAQTNKMMAVAEVYQTDISKVKLGQKAIITSQGFPGKLQGTVQQIGLQVNRQNVFSDQPGENLDSRIVEVKIRLTPEDSKKVSSLTNLQVQTAIKL
ncbi:ABC exporter membrane fusion protein [Dolichospermum sp. LEGE 00246]|uniref:ABC exporter membrane fusion protein n=1 Tax=Dolichospermum sp. LEGE 00246 TaxID=1828605 RepID=UPI00187E7915|nr:ABC exporter membrane fusion protein [Dolichospermum sp. LEGE 00246]MBE9257714.1 ABC exporter membrane fusion protein [Dolichospermum sp. LEGE 00246]MDK2410801.1 ABC exporter membrane fusion protein [Aphanizomenon sp. 202]MDK2461525.1 ABC exporter membrane fusion protein [Aphanizomenon sp. PH219]